MKRRHYILTFFDLLRTSPIMHLLWGFQFLIIYFYVLFNFIVWSKDGELQAHTCMNLPYRLFILYDPRYICWKMCIWKAFFKNSRLCFIFFRENKSKCFPASLCHFLEMKGENRQIILIVTVGWFFFKKIKLMSTDLQHYNLRYTFFNSSSINIMQVVPFKSNF